MKKRILSLTALVLSVILFCIGCGNPQAEAEAVRAFSEDYVKALELYCAIYGKGYAVADGYTVNESGNSYAQYAPVSSECPYTSTKALRADIEKYFTAKRTGNKNIVIAKR